MPLAVLLPPSSELLPDSFVVFLSPVAAWEVLPNIVTYNSGRACSTGLHRILRKFRPFFCRLLSPSETSRGTVSSLARGGCWRLALWLVVAWMHFGLFTLNPYPKP